MNQPLTKNAQTVQETLNRFGLTCTVLELPNSTRTALDAATSIGCTIEQIVKSLIFKTKKTEKSILVLASGSNKVHEQQIEFYVEEPITKADANFSKNITRFTIGGIPPIGHQTLLDFVFIDKDLMTVDELWAAAGMPNAVFSIKSKELLRITNGKIISISKSKE